MALSRLSRLFHDAQILDMERVSTFDLTRVNQLVADIEAELARAPVGSSELQDVRTEIETLKNVLKSPQAKPHGIRDSLHAVRKAMQAIRDEVATDSPFVAEIGHILGLA